MASEKLKYNIEAIVNELPGSITIGYIEGILLKNHKISRDTFYRDRKVKIDESFSIPEDRMFIYAALLECSIEELKNIPPKKIRPLNDRKLNKKQVGIVSKMKLVNGTAKLLALAFFLSSCVSYKGLGKCASFKTTPIHRTR